MKYFGKSKVVTKNNTYLVDWDNQTVTGGRFTQPVAFTNGFCAMGSNMLLYLCDGNVLRTSTVLDIKEVKNETDRNKQKSVLRLLCFGRN